MSVAKDHVVRFHYTLKNEAGQQLESSRAGEPLAYLHGRQAIISGLEAAITGKDSGDTFSITLPPEEAYGYRQENAVQRVPLKHLQGARKWKTGMMAWIKTQDGPQQGRIIKLGKFMADIDFNHPLAGLTLTFDIEIIEVRAASEEELMHGHAHGAGGHEH